MTLSVPMYAAEQFPEDTPYCDRRASVAPVQMHLVGETPDLAPLQEALRAAGMPVRIHATLNLALAGLSDTLANMVVVDKAGLCDWRGCGPVCDEVEIARDAVDRLAGRGVLVVRTEGGEPEVMADLLRAGVADLVSRRVDVATAARLVRRAARIAPMQRMAGAGPAGRDTVAQLSPRERDVLERLAQGERTKQIARTLNLSPRTVEMHCARLRRRLGVNSLTQAVGMWVSAQQAQVPRELVA